MNETTPLELIATEEKLIKSIAEFLENKIPPLDYGDATFIVTTWCHLFLHSAWHILSNHKDPIEYKCNDTNLVCAPGDTLAFAELSRTNEYAKYLTDSLHQFTPPPVCRREVHHLALHDVSKKVECLGFQTCLPSRFRFLLKIFSLGKIICLDNKYQSKKVGISFTLRQEMQTHVLEDLQHLDSCRANWLSQRIMDLFPISLLENLEERISELQHIKKPRNLFSANAWPLIDDWKIFSAVARRESASMLIGSPHAVGHAWLKHFWQREYEINNLDRYLTWGWKHPSRKVLPLGSPYLAGKKFDPRLKARRTNPSSEILISSAARPLHLLEYPYSPLDFEKYLTNQIDAANLISKKFNVDVVIRTRPSDLGWNITNRIAQIKNSKIKIEFQNRKFWERVKKSKLHICDNASTTAIETLFLGHPTIIYITDDYFVLSDAVKSDFNKLKNAGIFHDNRDSMLNQLDKVINDIDRWWQSENTQQCVADFLKVQGNSGLGLKAWSRALLSQV